MKWKILHESKGRMRLHLNKPRMSLAEADQLQDYLAALPGVRTAAVYERTCDVVVVYTENRASLVKGLAAFRFDVEALAEVPANSPRAVNREYQEKLVNMTIFHLARKLFLPMPLRIAYTAVRSLPYLWRGLTCLLRRKLEVEVLDALSIGVSMLRGDFSTAGSVMFLLRLGELLEEWTHKKSVADLAGAMALNVDKVWLKTGETEVLVPIGDVKAGDCIVIDMGCRKNRYCSDMTRTVALGFVTEEMRLASRPTGFSVGCTILELLIFGKVTRSFGRLPGKLYLPLIAKTMFSCDGANAALVSPMPW